MINYSFLRHNKIANLLTKYKSKGFEHVTFTGGEPTMNPDFLTILKIAKNLGYRTYVTSNGYCFQSQSFCRKVLPYINELCFSIHGHNSKIHNLHTQNKNSFSWLKKAIGNIVEIDYSLYLIANIVITRYNINYLKEIFQFLEKYNKFKHILISNFAPDGNALHNFHKITIPLSEVKKAVSELIEISKSDSMCIRFFGIPACILGKFMICSNDFYWDSRLTIEREKFHDGHIRFKSTKSYFPVRDRIKTKKCAKCILKKRCGGIFEKYYREFGDRELEPIIKESVKFEPQMYL